MPVLPRGVLTHFPVRYPRWVVAAGITALDTEGRTREPEPRRRTRAGRSADRSRDRLTQRTRRRRFRTDSREIGFGRNFGQDREGSVQGHGAIDIYGGYGLPIFATCSGVIVGEFTTGSGTHTGVGYMEPTTGNPMTGGNYLMLCDRLGYHHYYAHMQRRSPLQVGTVVSGGTQIGSIGRSGIRGHVQHLHYQVSTRATQSAVLFNPYNELLRIAPRESDVSPGGFLRIPIGADFNQIRGTDGSGA